MRKFNSLIFLASNEDFDEKIVIKEDPACGARWHVMSKERLAWPGMRLGGVYLAEGENGRQA